VFNNPLNRLDPHGTCVLRISGGIIEVVGGALAIPGTGGLGTVAALLVIANGFDNIIAGSSSLAYGDYKMAVLEAAIYELAPEEYAPWLYAGTQVLIPAGGLSVAQRSAAQSFENISPKGAASGAPKQTGVTVFRVEGTQNTRVLIGEKGEVAITGEKTLFLNFGSRARAEEFLATRISQGLPGAEVKSFEVSKSFLEDIHRLSVPESKARLFPNRPIIVDTTKAPDQFGLRPEQFDALKQAIRQGTGKRGF